MGNPEKLNDFELDATIPDEEGIPQTPNEEGVLQTPASMSAPSNDDNETSDECTAAEDACDDACDVPAADGTTEPLPEESTAAPQPEESAAAPQEDLFYPVEMKLNAVLDAQKSMAEHISLLEELFNAKISRAAYEEKIVDQMHKELQKYKEDMYAQLVRPILIDVIEMRDSIARVAASYRAKPENEQNIPNKVFADYTYDLQDILEKNAVEIYQSAVGDDFIPTKQRVVKKMPTEDAALHGKVAESLSSGYRYNGRTISAEKVMVYIYQENTQNNENSEVIEND